MTIKLVFYGYVDLIIQKCNKVKLILNGNNVHSLIINSKYHSKNKRHQNDNFMIKLIKSITSFSLNREDMNNKELLVSHVSYSRV